MKKIISLILILAMAAVMVPAMADTVLTDMAGREITLAAPAQKVVAITASNAEILAAVGAESTIVGRGEYCTYPESILSVPAVKSGAELNIEEVLALEPDVVIMDMMAQTEEQITALENAGLTVVMTKEAGIEGVYTAIELIGAVVGKEAEAAAVVSSMKADFAALAEEAFDGTASVYFEVSPLQWGLWTAGSGTFMNEIAELMGLQNAFADVEGWASVSEEQVIERNPTVIVTTSGYYGEGPTPVEEIMSREAWQDIDAVQAGIVFNADANEMTIPGPRLVDGAKHLMEFLNNFVEEEPAA